MSWLSCFSATESPKRRASSRVCRLGHVAQGEAHKLELVARRGKEEIALVALRVPCAIEGAPTAREPPGSDVVAGCQHPGAELARRLQKIAEFDGLVALDAGHGGFAGHVAVGEAVDHGFLEAVLIVEHVMRNADALRNRARVVDVLPGATGAGAVHGGAMVVELQGDADDVIALGLEQRRSDRGIHPARHGNDHARFRRATFDIQTVAHSVRPRRANRPGFTGAKYMYSRGPFLRR